MVDLINFGVAVGIGAVFVAAIPPIVAHVGLCRVCSVDTSAGSVGPCGAC